jgi:hypothetical protein
MHTTNTTDKLPISFSNSTLYHRYLFGMVLTNSAMQFATAHQCFWFLDVVASYQSQLRAAPLQVWTLQQHTGMYASIVATDAKGNILIEQQIQYACMEVSHATVLVNGKIIQLSSEERNEQVLLTDICF